MAAGQATNFGPERSLSLAFPRDCRGYGMSIQLSVGAGKALTSTRRCGDADCRCDSESGAGNKGAATRTVNSNASLPKPKHAKASSGRAGNEAEEKPEVAAIDARIKVAEESLKPSAERLKETVSQNVEKLVQASPRKRRNYLDIFATTVPDPAELGLEGVEGTRRIIG